MAITDDYRLNFTAAEYASRGGRARRSEAVGVLGVGIETFISDKIDLFRYAVDKMVFKHDDSSGADNHHTGTDTENIPPIALLS
ncbi:hypothetical protein GCM10009132_15090 [Serratia ureilytica]